MIHLKKREAINYINDQYPGYEIIYVVPALKDQEFYFQLLHEDGLSLSTVHGLINVKTKIIELNPPMF